MSDAYQTFKRLTDPLCHSCEAAVCEYCFKGYENLRQSVSETARLARADGWLISKIGDEYVWACPDCTDEHRHVMASNDFAEED